jgi:hypothetical protein
MSQPFGLCDADVHWVDSFNPLTLADEAYACDQELREQPFSRTNAYILYRAYQTGVFKSDLLVSLVDQPDRVGLPTGNVRIQGDIHKHQIAFPDGMNFMPDYAIENIG